MLIGGAIVGAGVWFFLYVLHGPDRPVSFTALFDLLMLMGVGVFFAGVALSLGSSKRMVRVMALGGMILLFLGFGGFMAGAVFATGANGFVPSGFEMPLGDLESVAVDAEGRIYTSAGFYSRIQVYDRTGQFLRGWFVDAGGGF